MNSAAQCLPLVVALAILRIAYSEVSTALLIHCFSFCFSASASTRDCSMAAPIACCSISTSLTQASHIAASSVHFIGSVSSGDAVVSRARLASGVCVQDTQGPCQNMLLEQHLVCSLQNCCSRCAQTLPAQATHVGQVEVPSWRYRSYILPSFRLYTQACAILRQRN